MRALIAMSLLVLCGGSTVWADPIDVKLVERSPQLRDYLIGRGYRNVGVLKFRLKQGNKPVSFSGATIVHSLPDRLESALINSLNQKTAYLGVVRDAAQHRRVRELICAHYRDLGLHVHDYFDSPIPGGDGNREFFIHAARAEP